MSKILKVKNVSDYCNWIGATSVHPLVCVIEYSELDPFRSSLNNYSVYGLFFQDKNDNKLSYGCGKYDFKDGSLICVAPGQIGGKEDDGELTSIGGWALLFHPDLLHGTHLEKEIKKCTFFNYSVNEALHMSREEIPSVQSCAEELCMSANYFSDVVKRLTGENAGHYIREFVIQQAKAKIAGGKTIAEAAYELGFEYPQHLTRMFKNHTGVSPTQYLSTLK